MYIHICQLIKVCASSYSFFKLFIYLCSMVALVVLCCNAHSELLICNFLEFLSKQLMLFHINISWCLLYSQWHRHKVVLYIHAQSSLNIAYILMYVWLNGFTSYKHDKICHQHHIEISISLVGHSIWFKVGSWYCHIYWMEKPHQWFMCVEADSLWMFQHVTNLI